MEVMDDKSKQKGLMNTEEADQKPLPQTNDIKVKDKYRFLIHEGNLNYEDVVGPNSLDSVIRKEYFVRIKDVESFLGENDKKIKRIQKASGATIVIVSSPEVKLYSQMHLELWGSVDQVNLAELLIKDAMSKRYRKPLVRTMLMQAPLCRNEVYIPFTQATKLLGRSFKNVVNLEAKSGAWIEVDPLELPSSPGHLIMRRLNIFGNRTQIQSLMLMINEAVLEPYIPESDANLEDKDSQAT